MSKTQPNAATRMSSFVLMVIFLVLALSLTALILATTALGQGNEIVAGYLLLLGFLGLALSTYVLFQTRRRILRLRIETPPITTTASMRFSLIVSRTFCGPPSRLKGFVLEVPKTEPPRGSNPEIVSNVRGMKAPSTSPRHPSFIPIIS